MAKVTLDELESYGDTLGSISRTAVEAFKSDMAEYAASLGPFESWTREQKAEFRDYAADVMAQYLDLYGEAAASVGTMFFERVLPEELEASVGTSWTDDGQAKASAHYWAKFMRGDGADLGQFLDGCASFLERNVSHSADLNVLEASEELSTRKVRIRYARVPSGPSCGFCIMLASRGFVYASKESAGEMSRFHDGCDCRIVAGTPGLEVEGYDYKGMYRRYRQCRDALGTDADLKAEWDALPPEEKAKYGRGERALPLSEDPDEDAKLREKLGDQADAYNDWLEYRVTREMDTRDREWLYNGTAHEPTYATERIKKSVTEENPWEDRTARRLAKHGIKPDFIQDYRWAVGSDGKKRKIGLPDFANGVEIKSPIESKNPRGAVDNYLDSCSKKEGLKRIVIDNTESNFTDVELRNAIVDVMKDYEFGEVTYLGKDEKLHVIKKGG